MAEMVNLVLHHGGQWSDDNYTRYENGKIAYKEVDIYYILMFELFGIFLDIGYKN